MTLKIDRRQFVRLTGLTALTATVPSFLHKTGVALAGTSHPEAKPLPGLKDNHVLVILQLAGGNDGLNTLVPYADDHYHKLRPRIGISANKVLKLDDHFGLHPELLELHRLFQDGGLALVPNVGYPNPSRSHFRSSDIWETASTSARMWKSGWLGRYFDAECQGVPGAMLGLRLGEQPALTFAGDQMRAATLANPSLLEVRATGALERGLEKINQVEPTGIGALDFIQRTGNETHALARRMKTVVRDVEPAVEYPPFVLCQSLRLVAQMIVANVPTRVFYVTLGGFDTHSTQLNRHAGLLQELSQALSLFRKDLKAQGQLDRVLLLTFSEFGRRASENKQLGTDHGTGNVVFLLGGKVKPGIHGAPPDLAKLDSEGDPHFGVDFRSIYTDVLRDWLNANAAHVLGEQFKPLALVQT
jgi:uncharacterized protein (DUF1501 family)